MTARASLETPVGPLTVVCDAGAVTAVGWGRVAAPNSDPLLAAALGELSAYFDGTLTAFTVPMRSASTGFQADFHASLSAIPYGQTRTYGEIASDLGVSAQAIGQACGANPIPVMIPCHRVLAADGLGGYSGAGGVEAKVALLKLEGAASLLL
ncbi:MAG: methylated-DNA--[protein]-cysteine S-methyltransferase [Pseudomonadota bacterium]